MGIVQNKAFFVSPEYILENYSMYLDSNIDAKSINSAILKAQQIDVQFTLGYNLYSQYINLITTGDIFLPQNVNFYNLLAGTGYVGASNGLNIGCIMDCTSLWAIYHLLDWLHFRVTNKAVVNKYSQYSNASSEEELNRLKYIAMEDAQSQDAEIRKQILNYPNDFQQYFTQIGVYRPPAKTNPYDNFFVSGKPGGRPGGGLDNSTTSSWEAGYRCCG